MPDAYGADANGVITKAKQLYVADGVGALKPVTNAWAADANGVLQRFWPATPDVTTASVVAGDPAWLYVTVKWTAVFNAARYEVWSSGASVWSGTALTASLAVEPLSVHTYTVRAYNSANAYSESTSVTYTASGMPAPTSLHTTSVVYNKVSLAWNAVSGATGYNLAHSSGTNIYTGSSTSASFTASPSTKYTVRVRAQRNAINGGWSPNLSATTPAPPGPAAGTYEYAPNAYSTWQNGTVGGSTYDDPKWRPQSDGMYANDQANYGSTRGIMTCFFFYNASSIQSALAGGRVTKFQVLMYRVHGVGEYSPKNCRWWMHNYTGVPGGAPNWGGAVAGGSFYGTLDDEEYKWIDLPASWGQQFVDKSWKGVAIGNDADLSRAMKFVRDGTHATGNIRITIG